MTMQLIETKTLGTTAASIEFTSIPQDATDLFVFTSLRCASGSTVDGLRVEFNNNTSSIYSTRVIFAVTSSGPGSETNPFNVSTASIIGYIPGASQTANTFNNSVLTIANYTASTNKIFSADSVSETNSGFSASAVLGLQSSAGLFNSTSAITSIKFSAQAGSDLVAGSTISLYKITKGSDGIVTVS
jgi:hypothetical protein